MGLENIEKSIVEITNKKASQMIDEAMRKASEIKEETENKIKEEDITSKNETEKLIEQLKQSFEALAKFEIKRTELSTKKEIIEKIFEKTVLKIETLDDKTLEKLTKKLLNDAKNEIDVKIVYCNEETKKWVPKEFKVKTEEMLGGIMAENNDGTIRVDNRFETILEEVRKDALKKIAKGVI